MAGNTNETSENPESPLFNEIAADRINDRSLEDTVVLWGYLRSINDEYWRLYLSLDFTEYVDIRKGAEGSGDYIHHIHVPGSPFGGTYVWVKRDAKLPHTLIQPAPEIAEFLGGQIAEDFLPETEAGNVPVQFPIRRGQRLGGIPKPTLSLLCGGSAFAGTQCTGRTGNFCTLFRTCS